MLQNLWKIQRNYLRRVLTGSTVNFRCTKIFFDQANTGLKSSANKKASQGFFFICPSPDLVHSKLFYFCSQKRLSILGFWDFRISKFLKFWKYKLMNQNLFFFYFAIKRVCQFWHLMILGICLIEHLCNVKLLRFIKKKIK